LYFLLGISDLLLFEAQILTLNLDQFHQARSWARAQKWGFEHHLKVIDLGFQIEESFSQVHVSANVFSDFVSFADGTTNSRGKKFCPDLSLSFQVSELKRFVFVEFERTSKTKTRYLERWLAYHNDPKLHLCLYIVTDPNLERRLQKLMEDHLRNTFQRSHLKFGVLLLGRDGRLKAGTTLKIVGRGQNSNQKFEDIFLHPSQTRQNFQQVLKHNDFNSLSDRVRLTTLPLPSFFEDLEVPQGTETVVNTPRLESNKY